MSNLNYHNTINESFLNLKAFSTRIPSLHIVLLRSEERSSMNFNIFGRPQKYFAIYVLRRSLYKSHFKTK